QEAKTEVGLYWRYEKALRSMESEIHSIAGATGAIYALPREVYGELPEDTSLDDVLTPLRIVLRGKPTAFEPAPTAHALVACCPLREYRPMVRTLGGHYQLLVRLPQAVLPWRTPIFIQFISHKLGMLVVPWALLSLLITNLFMLRGIYALTFSL